jgi:hypothetical protein
MASARRPATVPIAAAPVVISAPARARRTQPSTGTTRFRTCAMLHAAHHLLPDKTALGERGAAELVHIGLMRKVFSA